MTPRDAAPSRLRILVCALEAPLPPPNGLRLQLSALVRELGKSHDLRIVGYRMPDQEAPAPDSWRLLSGGGARGISRGLTLARAAFVGRPPHVDQLAARLLPPVGDELRSFDPHVIHVASGRLAALGGKLEGRPAVLAALDAWHLNVVARARLAPLHRRPGFALQAALTRRFESREYARFDRVVVVSDEDADALRSVNPLIRLDVIPNGVDAEAFGSDGSHREPGAIVFTGVMSFPPNVAAATFMARRVLPAVRADRTDARLWLVGRDPAPAVLELAGAPGVEVVGEVQDMRPWLSRASVYACPMVSGTGIKNKLLEAMANGLPCVATPLAIRGLRAEPGRDIIVGAGEAEIAAGIVRVLGDETLARALGEAGRSAVIAHHGWAAAADAYEQLYREGLEIPGTH
jgi:glycosyltransferase involved in cell wall biosynthesis